MDIRQIQALHAQYASQPVVIDIAGHVKAMPALPAPEADSNAASPLHRVPAVLRRAGKPAAIIVAVGALAAGGGISAAKVWHAMHMGLTAPALVAPTESSSPQATPAQAGPDTDRPINAAPPRPLTGYGFGGLNPVAPSALANVDTRALISPRTPSQPHQVSSVASSATDESRAAASPILVHRPAITAQPASAAPAVASAQAGASEGWPNAPQPQHASQSNTERSAAPATTATSTEPATVATAAAPSAKPALRPIHHMSAHRTHESGETVGATGTPAQTPALAPAAAMPATTGKSGDVQLF